MRKNNHAWKACRPRKGLGSSNLPHSAIFASIDGMLDGCAEGGEEGENVASCGRKTDKKPTRMKSARVSLYWRDRSGKDGMSPLLLAINYGGSSTYIPVSSVRLRPDQWDRKLKRVINHPKASTINSVAQSLLGRANDAVLELMRDGGTRGWTLTQVKNAIVDKMFPDEGSAEGVLAVMERYKAACRAPKTAEKYGQTILHMERWLGAKARRLEFVDITVGWLKDFERYMEGAGLGINSRSIHFRNLRTVFNYALTHELTNAHYPFREFKIKHEKSQPNALNLETLKKLWDYVPPLDHQRYWHDLWKLTFALIGINLADMCELQDMKQGRVSYTRRKTGRLYSVKVEPEAKEIIERRRGRKHLLDILERYKDEKVARGMCSKVLSEIGKAVGIERLTMYTARYTWATMAMELDIPIEVISQGLGHNYGLAVTLGYIMPDRRKVDAANRKVLDLLK